jgi:hypothetical protein
MDKRDKEDDPDGPRITFYVRKIIDIEEIRERHRHKYE